MKRIDIFNALDKSIVTLLGYEDDELSQFHYQNYRLIDRILSIIEDCN
jgi:hypothetical protein